MALELRDMIENKDAVLFGTINRKVIIFYSPTNLGGTRSCKTNTVVYLIGLGTNITVIILDKKEIISSKKFKGAEKSIILKCNTKDKS